MNGCVTSKEYCDKYVSMHFGKKKETKKIYIFEVNGDIKAPRDHMNMGIFSLDHRKNKQ